MIPRADQGMGMDIRVSQKLFAVGYQTHLRAGREGSQRRSRDVHLIAEHPRVPGIDAPILSVFQAQFGYRQSIRIRV